MSESTSAGASSIERQFWLLQRLQPETRAYHIGSVFRIRGDLGVAELKGAFEDLVARHSVLRTTFEERGGALQRRVHATLPPVFEEEDATRSIEPDGDAVAAELRRPFDLARGPLLRLHLWRCAPDDHVLAWTMPHIVTDLASKSLLAAELSERYALRRAGRAAPPVCAPASEQYPAFAAWEREWLQGDAAHRAEDYFAERLAAVPPPLALPEDRPRPPVQSARGARIPFELPPDLAGSLEDVAAEWQSKPFLVLLTAYALLLSRYAGEERVVIGVPFTNRRREASHSTVGCFVNILPVPVDRTGDPPFRGLLQRVRETLLAHHRHQELSLERIVARCRPTRDTSRNPLFQAGFTFEPPMALTLEGLEVTSYKVHAGGAQLDVFLSLWKTGQGFAGQLEYCADLFQPTTVERLVRNYLSLLERVLDAHVAATVPVSRLDVMHPAESELVVRGWNATDVRYQAPERLDQLFLRQVELTPDAPALRMGPRRWSYRELADHARTLALELRGLGVGPGDRVGLYLERSFEMVTAILATVLAGAAYVPIDPEYPEHRIRLLLEDARPRCVLTHGASPVPTWLPADVPAWPVRLDAPGGPRRSRPPPSRPRTRPT